MIATESLNSADYRRRHTALVLGVIFAGWLGFIAVLAADGYDFAAGDIGPAGSAEFARPN